MFQSQNVAISLRIAKKVIIFLIVDRRTFSNYFQLALLNAETTVCRCRSWKQNILKVVVILLDLAIRKNEFISWEIKIHEWFSYVRTYLTAYIKIIEYFTIFIDMQKCSKWVLSSWRD